MAKPKDDKVILPNYGETFQLVEQELVKVDRRAQTAICRSAFNDRPEILASDHLLTKRVMPGVIMVREMAECALLLLHSDQTAKEKAAYTLNEIHDVKFHRKVSPGAKLQISANMLPSGPSSNTADCKLQQGELLVASGQFNFDITDHRFDRECLVTTPTEYSGDEIWDASGRFIDPWWIIESMAQTTMQVIRDPVKQMVKLFLFQGIRRATFHRLEKRETPVLIHSKIKWARHEVGHRGIAFCEATPLSKEHPIATAEIEFGIIGRRPHLIK